MPVTLCAALRTVGAALRGTGRLVGAASAASG
jgi:hypothetical protein